MSFDTDEGRWDRLIAAMRYLSIVGYDGNINFSMKHGRVTRGTVERFVHEAELLRQTQQQKERAYAA